MRNEGQDWLLRLASWIDALSVAKRALVAGTLAVASASALVMGRLLTLNGDLSAWIVRVLLFEPAGMLSILAAYIVAFPTAPLSVYLSSALARRRYASAAVVVLSLGLILEVVRWSAQQFVLSQTR
jgi:hypothetical protein